MSEKTYLEEQQNARTNGTPKFDSEASAPTTPAQDAIQAAGSKSKIAAGLLGIFLGGLGIHKFYLGYRGPGLIMLIIYVVGWFFSGVPSLVVGFIGFIEGIIYLTRNDEEFRQVYVLNEKDWF